MLNEVGIFLFLILKIVFLGVAFIFVINGIDEFFIDLCYFFRETYRKLFKTEHNKCLTEEQLLAKPEQAIAVMIPCWDESATIQQMLKNTIKTVNYSNYVIFIGTYPNDPATQQEVDLLREKYGNVERIVTPDDGPTNKADGLNWLYEGILVFEKNYNKKFDIFIIENSEDIIHPLMLKLCNYVIPKLDMIQIPVHPMPRHWTNFTGNHYLDEFAEKHTRDLIVREALTGAVPSAGVGTALSRKTLKTVAAARSHQPFNTNPLTEDYEFGLQLKEFGLKQAFVRQWIWRNKMVKGFFSRIPKQKQVKEFISIREFFPNTFHTAIRQKTQHVTDIALQRKIAMGWHGNLAYRYMLWRDRKTLVTNLVNFFGNFLIVFILGLIIYNVLSKEYNLPPLVDGSSWITALISACLFFLFWRIIMRILFVVHTYDWLQGLLSIPRFFWANTINFIATTNAIVLYTKMRTTSQKAASDKTDQVYPSKDELSAYRRKLGDLLLDRRFLTIEQLNSALEIKAQSKKRLGEILIDLGYITEDQLIQTLGIQFTVETQDIDPYSTPLELLDMVPFKSAVAYNVYPLALENNQLIMATNEMLDEKSLRNLEKSVGHYIVLRIAANSDISFAIRRGYERRFTLMESNFLGKALVENSEISPEYLTEALRTQRRRHLPLGEILIRQGVLTVETLTKANKDFLKQKEVKRMGEFLLAQKHITPKQLNIALVEQAQNCPLLGEVLIEQGVITPENLEHFLSVWETN